MNRRSFIFLGLSTVFLLVILISTVAKYVGLRSGFNRLKEEYQKLQLENQRLQSFLDYLGLRANIEREARVRLNLSKPGETIVIFVSPSPFPTLLPTKAPSWREWFRWPY